LSSSVPREPQKEVKMRAIKKMVMYGMFGLLTVSTLQVIGCTSTKQSVQQESSVGINIPPTSKFAKISKGMSQKQVTDLIGTWNDVDTFRTAKSYNPMYFGTDRVHQRLHYKGEGRIEMDRNDFVVEIEYDPSETGYKKQ